jgi:uncharacterized protein (TIGR02328 family)
MSCCNLRGKGWGKRNAAVGYLYEDPMGEDALARYHELVLEEMEYRGMEPDEKWWDTSYCGKNREAREVNWFNFEEVTRRNIPLQGHTLELYLKDIKALHERGLSIEVRSDKYTCMDGRHGVYYYAKRENTETQYWVESKEIINGT